MVWFAVDNGLVCSCWWSGLQWLMVWFAVVEGLVCSWLMVWLMVWFAVVDELGRSSLIFGQLAVPEKGQKGNGRTEMAAGQ